MSTPPVWPPATGHYGMAALVVGALVTYVVVLSGKEPKSDSEASPSAAILLEFPSSYEQVLAGRGTTTDRTRAAASDTTGGVVGIPILLAKGSGTAGDPWVFQTFGDSVTCPAATITATSSNGFEVVSPKPVTVEAPSTTAQATQSTTG